MKYLVLSDIHYFFSRNRKVLIFYGMCVIIYILYGLNFASSVEKYNIITSAFGINFDYITSGPLEILMFIFNYVFYCFLSLSVFLKDIINNSDTIFLRMSFKKWITFKILIIMIIGLIIRLLSVFLGFIIIKTLLFTENKLIFDCLYNFISLLLIQNILLLIYISRINIWSLCKNMILIFTSLIIINRTNNILVTIIFLVIILMSIGFEFNKNGVKLMEKENA